MISEPTLMLVAADCVSDPRMLSDPPLRLPDCTVTDPVGPMVIALETATLPPPLRLSWAFPPFRPVMVSDLMATFPTGPLIGPAKTEGGSTKTSWTACGRRPTVQLVLVSQLPPLALRK